MPMAPTVLFGSRAFSVGGCGFLMNKKIMDSKELQIVACNRAIL
jgi:hypothetical protein